MPPRNLNIIVIAAFVSGLCYFAHRRTKTAMMVGDALELIDAYYVDPVDKEQLLISAMNGMTSTLDDHSEYIPQEDYESFQDNINQEFAGIGIFVEQPEKEKPVRVITPLVGSPALAAGLLPGDQIVRVDGEDVSTMVLQDVSSRLKGQIGTTVQLVVARGDDNINISVRRGRIELESVIGDYRDAENHWVYRLRDDPSIAYIRLTSFGEKTVKELEQVLIDLDNDFSGLVLDLRGNGGGLLHAAVDVSNMFLNSGKIVSTRTRGGKIEDRFSAEPGTLVSTNKPIAILIDGNSASASEIVAACLQDNQRAAIVGTRSYGKGTVQNILPLQYGRSALRLTVARYYRPNGKNIHRGKEASDEDEWGVTPDEDFEIELDADKLDRLAKRWREASYPSLANIESSDEVENSLTEPDKAEPDSTNSEATEPDSPDADSVESEREEPNSEASDPSKPASDHTDEPESGLLIDPQLRRAVEYLRDASQNEVKQPAAA
ncbi:MAG: S41 family peptidase [Rubripirellula sp.]